MTKPNIMDEINLAIVRHLWDGRKPYAEIAQELGITTNTVRNRVNRLIEAGVLQVIGLVDPEALPGHSSGLVAFKVRPDKVEQALEEIGRMKNVVAATYVSGRYDILAIVFFNEEHNHQRFIFQEITKVEGIVSVETFFSMKAVNWQLRYVL